MTSRECINATLKGEKKDRLGHFDIFSESVLEKWQREKFKKEIYPEEEFNLDIVLFGYRYKEYSSWKKDGDLKPLFPRPSVENLESCDDNYPLESEIYKRAVLEEKYICVAVPGPFQHVCNLYGYNWLFGNLIHRDDLIKKLYRESVTYNLKMLQIIYNKGYKFDGVWIWEDVAYDKGLFFSYSYYEEMLGKFHKILIGKILELDKKVFFHSDGDIKEVLQKLVSYGVRAVHPLENNLFDIKKIKKCFPEIVWMGNIDYLKLLDTKDDFIKRLSINDKYIFGADSSISSRLSLKEYKNLIKYKDLLWE